MAVSIAFYSSTGNNEVLAEHLADRLQCGLIRVAETRRRTPLRTLADLALGLSPPIAPIGKSLRDYRHIVLVGPVWASRLATPLRTFIAAHRDELVEYSFLTFCGYERRELKDLLTAELTRRVGRAPRAVCELTIADLAPHRKLDAAHVIRPYRLCEDDLSDFAGALDLFLDQAGLAGPPGSRRDGPIAGSGKSSFTATPESARL